MLYEPMYLWDLVSYALVDRSYTLVLGPRPGNL